MVAHVSMKSRHNTSPILPGPQYHINNFSSPCLVVIHSHICRREFTVPSLFPLFASNTDLMTSLSIFGNISSIWKIINRPTYDSTILATCNIFFHRNGLSYNKLFSVLLSPPVTDPPPKDGPKVESDRGVGGWVDRQTEMMMSKRRRRRPGPYQESNPSQPSHSLMTFQIMSH